MPLGARPVLQESATDYAARGRLHPESFEGAVTFRTTPPPRSLAWAVEHAWAISWSDLREPFTSREVLHAPFVDIFLAADEAAIQGTFTGHRSYRAEGSGRIVGVRFRPGGFAVFWPGRMADLTDEVVALERALPNLAARRAEVLALPDAAAAEAMFAALEATEARRDSRVARVGKVLAAIEAGPSIATVTELAASVGRSERWVQDLLRGSIGIGAKWLIRRSRLLNAAERLRADPALDQAGLAFELGYSSQQHFITEFRLATGYTPARYARMPG